MNKAHLQAAGERAYTKLPLLFLKTVVGGVECYLQAFSTAAPTASAAGYAPGCLYTRVIAGGSSVVYQNTGTAASATWVQIGTTSVAAIAAIAAVTASAAATQDALTDNSGGSASTTIAAISDTATKNAIASIVAQLAKIKVDVAARKTTVDAVIAAAGT